MSSDDGIFFIMCDYCEDQRGQCDRNFLVECKTWQALCKAYAFEPGMVITFDIRPEDDIEGNTDIWVDVQTPRVIPLYEFLNHIYVFDIVYSKIVDN